MAFINITASNNKGIVKNIDRTEYFRLGKSHIARLDLYNFAMALGYQQGYPTELSEKKESFVREEYVEKNNCRYIYGSLYFSEHVNKGHKEDLENLTSTECTFSLADEYANTGFSVLSDYMKNKSEETLMWELLRETDEMYEQYEKDFNI